MIEQILDDIAELRRTRHGADLMTALAALLVADRVLCEREEVAPLSWETTLTRHGVLSLATVAACAQTQREGSH